MATPFLEDAEFLFATCSACDKSVLTHVVDFDDDGNEVRRCVHCDELEERGYRLIDARGCGNGGGCSSGCGTRQRS